MKRQRQRPGAEQPDSRVQGERRIRMPVQRTATVVGPSVATINRFVARQDLSSLNAHEPAKPPLRHEHEEPSERLYIDTK